MAPKPGAREQESKATSGEVASSSSKKKGERESRDNGDGEQREYAHDVVRTDAKTQKLDKFFHRIDSDEAGSRSGLADPGSSGSRSSVIRPEERREINFTSVKQLRVEVESAADQMSLNFIRDAVFVGMVKCDSVLLQIGTCLHLCDLSTLSGEMFYQLALYEFGNYGRVRIDPPASVERLVMAALNMPEAGWNPEDGSKEEFADSVVELVLDKSAMLDDLFGIKIDENCCLCSFPLLQGKIRPDLTELPLFFLRIATDVTWNEEKSCFQSLCLELARFYTYVITGHARKTGGPYKVEKEHAWMVEHVLVPALKTQLSVPKKFLHDGTFLNIADTKQLYKVFERC